MSHHHETHTSRRHRRAQFERQPGRRGPSLTVVMAGVSVILAAVFVYLVSSGGPTISDAVAVQHVAGGGDVRLPVAAFDDGVARFYTHTMATGREVRFFVMKSSDGVVRAAFDACDTCYEARMGYHQQGDEMVCNKCRRTFRSVDINVLQGGCNPAPLERRVVGDHLVLTGTALERGGTYF